MRKEKKRKDNFINSLLDMPLEISSDIPKITMLGFQEVLIENYKGVLEYEEYLVRVATYIGVVNIMGNKFNLEKLTDDEVLISGNFEKIELEKDVEE